jgi:hypothetical protein
VKSKQHANAVEFRARNLLVRQRTYAINDLKAVWSAAIANNLAPFGLKADRNQGPIHVLF